MPYLRHEKHDSVKSVEWFAPAKVNLFLKILGKRADGYHDLESLMVPLSFGDRLQVRLLDETKSNSPISLRVSHQDLPNDVHNLAYRAAALFRERLQQTLPPIEIALEKKTPIGAGLGGGSSDAAAVLAALNFLTDEVFSQDELLKMGAKLGADVPFFLLDQAAIASGTGTELEIFPLQERLWFLLINPGFAVSTAWVYQNFKAEWSSALTKGSLSENILSLKKRENSSQNVGQVHWETLLVNDLERVTGQSHPEVLEIKNRLLSLGAKAALMSGSGPTVFGVFPGAQGEKWANETSAQLKHNKNWFVCAAHSIP